jgi:hypothetical protein
MDYKPFKTVLTITLLFCLLQANAQNKTLEKFGAEEKGWVSAQIGLGIPVGDYASTSSNNNNAGNAELGLGYKLEIAIKLKSVTGLMVTGFGGYNNFDKSSLGTIPSYIDLNVNGWKYLGVMGGFYLKLFKEQSPFYIKGQVGYVNATSPEYSLSYNGTLLVKLHSASAGTLAVCGGFGFKLELTKNVSILYALEYTHFKPEFKDITGESLQKNGTMKPQNLGSMTQTMDNIGVNVGFCFKLQ